MAQDDALVVFVTIVANVFVDRHFTLSRLRNKIIPERVQAFCSTYFDTKQTWPKNTTAPDCAGAVGLAYPAEIAEFLGLG